MVGLRVVNHGPKPVCVVLEPDACEPYPVEPFLGSKEGPYDHIVIPPWKSFS